MGVPIREKAGGNEEGGGRRPTCAALGLFAAQCVLCHAWAACAGQGARVVLLARLPQCGPGPAPPRLGGGRQAALGVGDQLAVAADKNMFWIN